MRKLKVFIPFLIFSLFLFHFVSANEEETIRIKVKENRIACTGVGPMECLQVKFKPFKAWELFYQEIAGFDYQEGFRYTLLVSREKIENPPADASAYAYGLVKIIKKKKIPAKKTKKESHAIDFLAKHKWTLIQMNGKIKESTGVYLIFDKDRGSVQGNSGCNGYFGPFKIEEDRITFDKLAGTLMACEPEKSALEEEFLSILRSVNLRFDIADQTLNLYKGDELVLMFGLSPL